MAGWAEDEVWADWGWSAGDLSPLRRCAPQPQLGGHSSPLRVQVSGVQGELAGGRNCFLH